MSRLQNDLTGQRYGRLLVVAPAEKLNGTTAWHCRCDCGQEAVVRAGALRAKVKPTRSCGCLVKDTRTSIITDRTGERYGRLVVVEQTPGRSVGGQVLWVCRCDCGNVRVLNGNALQSGNTKSCGCLTHGRPKHGMSGTAEYRAWKAMKERCLKPNNPRYADYGGRGITIHPDWVASFEAFFSVVGRRPDGTSLDRIDNEGNYEPGNVRWATASQQANNKRRIVANSTAAELQAEIAALRAELERVRGLTHAL